MAELVLRYQRGETVRGLAQSLGMARTTVAKHLASAGVVMRVEVQDSEQTRMIELFEQGYSLNRIGRETGRDPKTVKSLLLTAGLLPGGLRS